MTRRAQRVGMALLASCGPAISARPSTLHTVATSYGVTTYTRIDLAAQP